MGTKRAAGDPPLATTPDRPAPGTPSRRELLVGGVGGLALMAGTLGGASWVWESRRLDFPLYSQTIAFAGPRRRVVVAARQEGRLFPGSRVLRDARHAGALWTEEQQWLDSLHPWTRREHRFSGLLRDALLDLRVLTDALPAPVAAWTTPWRYVWPRDAAHVAVALAVAGRSVEALTALRFLQRVQRADGRFEARYVLGGFGPPDDRPAQLDGVGWALWAAAEVLRTLPPERAARVAVGLSPLLTRATTWALAETDNPAGLPRACPDYWEIREDRPTLGTAAALACGLAHAPPALEAAGRPDVAARASAGAERLRASIDASFGARGYPRHVDGDDRDAAVAFLLPPYTAAAADSVLSARATAFAQMRRPAGGLAPGVGWHRDGVSWTPSTALAALSLASCGQPDEAERYLDWLRTHRTAAGSLPEKVLYDGTLASVAPLSWTAALTVLAVKHLLDGETALQASEPLSHNGGHDSRGHRQR